MNFVTCAEKLLSIDSSPEVGNVYVCDYLSTVVKSLGLQSTRKSFVSDGIEQQLLYVYQGQRSEKEFVLWSNLETHDPGTYSLWRETDCNPYLATIKGDKIYGLGSASGKLCFLAKLFALSKLDKDWQKTSPLLVGGFGSYIDKEGAKFFLEDNTKSKIDAVLVSEPSSLNFVSDYGGSVIVKILLPFSKEEKSLRTHFFNDEVTSTQTKIFKGNPSFAFFNKEEEHIVKKIRDYLQKLPKNTAILNMEVGNSPYLIPSEGFLELDAISHPENEVKEKLLSFLDLLDKIFGERFKKYVSRYDLKNFPRYNLGFIRTTKEGVELEGCFFLTEGVSKDRVKDWLKLLSAAGVETSITKFKPAVKLAAETCLYKKIAEASNEMDLSFQKGMQYYMSDTYYFLGKGISSLGFGPGTMEGGASFINEFNLMSQVEKSINVYQDLMERICK